MVRNVVCFGVDNLALTLHDFYTYNFLWCVDQDLDQLSYEHDPDIFWFILIHHTICNTCLVLISFSITPATVEDKRSSILK